MAEEAAPRAAAASRRAPWPAIGIGVAVAVAALLALLIGPPLLVLAGCIVAGLGITYLSGVALTFEERIAYGTVLGAMAVAALSFIFSMVVRDVTGTTVLAATAIAVVAGSGVAAVNRLVLTSDLRGLGVRWSPPLTTAGHPWPVFAIFFACAAVVGWIPSAKR